MTTHLDRRVSQCCILPQTMPEIGKSMRIFEMVVIKCGVIGNNSSQYRAFCSTMQYWLQGYFTSLGNLESNWNMTVYIKLEYMKQFWGMVHSFEKLKVPVIPFQQHFHHHIKILILKVLIRSLRSKFLSLRSTTLRIKK